MSLKSKENQLMWERYMETSFDDVPLVKNPRQPINISKTDTDIDPLLTYDHPYYGGDEEDAEFADFESDHMEPDGDEVDATVISLGPPMGGLNVGMAASDSDIGFSGGPDDGIPDSPEERVNVEIYSELKRLAEYSKSIFDHSKTTEFEPWMQAKIIKASNYICDVYYYLDAEVEFKGVKQDYGDFGSHEVGQHDDHGGY